MKKKNLIILIIVCILSMCLFSGLLVHAFQRQEQKDLQNEIEQQDNDSEIDENIDDTEQNASDSSKSTTGNSGKGDSSDLSGVNSDIGNNSSNSDTKSQESASLTPTPTANQSDKINSSTPITLGFAGDVNLDESYYPVKKYDSEGQDITKCFSKDLLDEMNNVDVMMLNNEFSYSTRGTKELDKSYTFRADPKRVEILTKMGVDIVSLANNHALDYGKDALLDTFDTLDAAGINYVGAGKTMNRAKAPIYYTIGDKKIAFVAASHVIFAMDWYATDTQPGMVGTYDPTLIIESIKEAKVNSDFVAIFVHWGIERNEYPESYQRNLSKAYIDAGADAVIGCHPHVMQGLEFYKDKPIAYSLGNYWFNASTKESGMVKLYLNTDDTVKIQLLPAMTKDTVTYLLTDEAEKDNYYNYMESISYQVTIDKDGFVTQAEE